MVRELMELIGFILIVIAFALVYVPLAIFAAGVVFLLMAALGFRKEKPSDTP